MTDILTKADQIVEKARTAQAAFDHLSSGGGGGGQGTVNIGVTTRFGDVPSLFASYSQLPDSAGLRSLRESLRTESVMLLNNDWSTPTGYDDVPTYQNPDLDTIADIRREVAPWTGDAAGKFTTNYVDRFDSLTENLFVAAFVPTEALGAIARLWEVAHEDIHAIADATMNALDMAFLKCLGEVLDIAATRIPSVIAIGQAVQAGKGVAVTVIKEIAGEVAKDHTSTSSNQPSQILADMSTSISALTDRLRSTEQQILDALTANAGYVGSHPGLFVAGEDAWGVSSTDEHGTPGSEVLGQSRTGVALAVDLAKLYTCAQDSMPTLAAQFTSAGSALEGVDISTLMARADPPLGAGATGCSAAFHTLTGAVGAHASSTGTHLVDVADALCDAARSYASVDEDTRLEFDRLIQ